MLSSTLILATNYTERIIALLKIEDEKLKNEMIMNLLPYGWYIFLFVIFILLISLLVRMFGWDKNGKLKILIGINAYSYAKRADVPMK